MYEFHKWNGWQIRHLAINLSAYDICPLDYGASAAKLSYANDGSHDVVRTESHVTRWACRSA